MLVDDRINPRWVAAVLKERGIRAPDVDVLARTIAALDGEERAAFRAKVAALHRGTEAAADLDWMADWVDNLPVAVGEPATSISAAKRPDSAPLAAEPPAAARPSAAPAASGNALQRSHHVYGNKAAMCVELVQVAGDDDGRGSYATVMLEFAPAAGDGRRFAWTERKIQFRLGLRELPRVGAVLMGDMESIELDGHGPTHNKSLWIEDQGGAIFFKVRQGRVTLGVPLSAGDLYAVAARVMYALALNAPGIDALVSLRLVRRTAHMELAARQAQADRDRSA